MLTDFMNFVAYELHLNFNRRQGEGEGDCGRCKTELSWIWGCVWFYSRGRRVATWGSDGRGRVMLREVTRALSLHDI